VSIGVKAKERRPRPIDGFVLTGMSRSGKLAPKRSLADVLKKPWMEGAVPLTLAALLYLGILVFTPVGLGDSSLNASETAQMGLVAIGLTFVMVGGGIDLSVGSVAAVTALGSLVAQRVWGLPMLLVVVLCPVVGAVLGSLNGFLIAKLGTRPFITTLVTLLTFRGLVKVMQAQYSSELVIPRPSQVWLWIADGRIVGIPLLWLVFAVVLLASHLALTRSRWGWWVTSVGSDRRSARRNGIPVDRVVFFSYVASGTLAATAGLIASARFGRADATVASGWELVALTAVVLGGVSLRGGRGSVLRAAVGVWVVAALQQASILTQMKSGGYSVLLSIALLVFALLDLKWGKYRHRFAEKIAVDPTRQVAGPLPDITDRSSVWAINDALTEAPPIGLGKLEGAEDMVLDVHGNLYTGDRRGWIWKYEGPDLQRGRIFARTGGHPLGTAWDLEGRLVTAVSGMGVMRVDHEGAVELVCNRVPRTRFKAYDDSAMRFADDLDVAPDGSIYVSDFSSRVGAAEYAIELVEMRPNGRLIRIDPDGSSEVVVSNYAFPNGVCTSHDGQSVLIASTLLYRVDRLWISGPRQGQLEPVLENLPGCPDNINRASDGSYWMTFVAMRTPLSDLLNKYPATRRRMTKGLPADDWLVPQLNISCVLKFSEAGEISNVMWDQTLANYPMVTSVKEYDGWLYLGGINNNRLGRLELDPADIGSIDTRKVPGAAHTAPAMGQAAPTAREVLA
jgi:ribose transport system permease protein